MAISKQRVEALKEVNDMATNLAEEERCLRAMRPMSDV